MWIFERAPPAPELCERPPTPHLGHIPPTFLSTRWEVSGRGTTRRHPIRDDWHHPTSGLGTTGPGPAMDRSDLGSVPWFDQGPLVGRFWHRACCCGSPFAVADGGGTGSWITASGVAHTDRAWKPSRSTSAMSRRCPWT